MRDPFFKDPNAHHLTHSQATVREASLAVSQYNLSMELTEGDTYSGTVKINITMTKESNEIFLDFHGVKVKKVMINGESGEIKFERHKIQLPSMNIGEN